MFSWNSRAFSMIQQMLAILSLVPLSFSKSTLGTRKFSVHTHCWSLVWRILSITLLVCEMNVTVQKFEYSLSLPFFGIGMNIDLFQSYGHCWVFQICWYIECSTLTVSSFSIWNSLAGIPSPLLALFAVILPKTRLTSCSRMFGSGADFYSLRSPLGFGLKTQAGCKGLDIKSRSLTSALLEGLCLRNCLPHSSLSLCSVFVSLSLPAFFSHFSPLFFFSLLYLLFSSLEMFPLKGFGRAPF